MRNHFREFNILLPRNCLYEKWAVIACDQHTSEPEYWNNVRSFIDKAPSTLDMFFPEADLPKLTQDLFAYYSNNMRAYIDRDFFSTYPDSYVYVERTLLNGTIRKGIVGVVDLEYYDYTPKTNTKIYASEATVLQRVPPRISMRKIADLEFSHAVIFCEDAENNLIGSVFEKRDRLEKLYDFDLMNGGGHIRGYLLSGADARAFETAVSNYEAEHCYLVGDGNHSLITAKLTYEALKEANPEQNWENHPARFAMVELENVHDDAMVFEPIHRIAICDDPHAMMEAFAACNTADGVPVHWVYDKNEGCVRLPCVEGELVTEALQRFFDRWSETNPVTIDYIHGSETARNLAQESNTVGFLLPDFDKSILFPYVLSGKVMPKKTFSIGHAEEKRYYLEGRKIK